MFFRQSRFIIVGEIFSIQITSALIAAIDSMTAIAGTIYSENMNFAVFAVPGMLSAIF